MRSLFKKYFVAGALVLVPIALTVWVLQTLILWCNELFTALIPTAWRSVKIVGYEVPGLGLLFTLILILLTGVLSRLYFGKKLLNFGDRLIHKIPLGSGIYKGIKQMLHAIVSTNSTGFRQVVLVPFPNRESYVVGFISGQSAPSVCEALNKPTVNVFVPTAPNPTSGFLLLVPRDHLIPMNLSPEQALKFILSGGTVHY